MDLNSLVAETLASLWPPFAHESHLSMFAPELILCGSILGLLLIRLLPFGKLLDAGYLAMVGLALALGVGFLNIPSIATELFGGMIVYDTFTFTIRAILLFFTIIFVVFTKFSGRPAREDGTDVYCLILGAVLGKRTINLFRIASREASSASVRFTLTVCSEWSHRYEPLWASTKKFM